MVQDKAHLARFVLVPGAWPRAWAWKGATRANEKKGIQAHLVELSGMRERVHLAASDPGKVAGQVSTCL